ncbi:MAG: hypothetical protein WA919_29695 [Coleofasciculaceae cyanobacterium]
MISDFADLQITTEDVETLVNLDISTTTAINVYRAVILRNSRQVWSVLLTELFVFVLILVFVMPVSLLVLRNSGNLPEHQAGVLALLAIIVVITILGLIVWNFYLWKQAKKSSSLAKLMEELDKYNWVLQEIDVLAKLESVRNSKTNFNNCEVREELIKALKVTRESLISALQVEKVIRQHQKLIGNNHQLLVSLENNLAALMAFNTSNQSSEYGHLLDETLKIGMSAYKEVSKLNTTPF